MEEIEHKMVNVNGVSIHVAMKGEGPVILFIHGFPELWFSWRYQIKSLSSLGYKAVAVDLRGFGDSDAPAGYQNYTVLHVVGDIIGVLDAVAPPGEKACVVGHDWGAYAAWFLCLYRPDKVKALVNMSVEFTPRNPKIKPLEAVRDAYGDDYYICRFQEVGGIEAEIARVGTKRFLKQFFTYLTPGPLFLPRGKQLFMHPPDAPIDLPTWLTEDELSYYTDKFEKNGFTGGLNYYRVFNLNWELNAPWTGAKVKVPSKFIVGDLDLTYNTMGAKDYIHKGGFKNDVPLLEDVVIMEGVGHWVQQEKPEEISKHIYDFIRKY